MEQKQNELGSRGSQASDAKGKGGESPQSGASYVGETVGFPQRKLDFAIGGQALIEGVMMRSPNWVTVAVRKPNGDIVLKKDPFRSLTKRYRFLNIPIVRGIIMIVETMGLGMRSLNFSAEQSLEEETPDPQPKDTRNSKIFQGVSAALSIVFSLALAIFLFKFVPLFSAEQLRKVLPALQQSTILFNFTDGGIRIAIFFLYLFFLTIFPVFRRVFQYHGAEHQSIFAYEKGLPLTTENVQTQSPRHPRCGTSFLLISLLVSIVVLSLVPRHPVFWMNFLRRLSVVPIILGLGYEVLKATAKLQHHPMLKILTAPGIATQYLTTKKPDDKQVEVATAALNEALLLEKSVF